MSQPQVSTSTHAYMCTHPSNTLEYTHTWKKEKGKGVGSKSDRNEAANLERENKENQREQSVCGWADSQKSKRIGTLRLSLDHWGPHDFFHAGGREGEGKEPPTKEPGRCLTCTFKDAFWEDREESVSLWNTCCPLQVKKDCWMKALTEVNGWQGPLNVSISKIWLWCNQEGGQAGIAMYPKPSRYYPQPSESSAMVAVPGQMLARYLLQQGEVSIEIVSTQCSLYHISKTHCLHPFLKSSLVLKALNWIQC